MELSGYVGSYFEKDAAEKAAKRVYGVRGVANNIQVKLPSQRTDPEIARDAVQELESHVSIPADQIKVTVRNGWITLAGVEAEPPSWMLAEFLCRSTGTRLNSTAACGRGPRRMKPSRPPGPHQECKVENYITVIP